MPCSRFLLGIYFTHGVHMGFSGGSAVKNPPARQETQIQSLGEGDPLEEGLATPSSTVAGRIPWAEEPGRLRSTGFAKSRT